jgi:hypothetical protein
MSSASRDDQRHPFDADHFADGFTEYEASHKVDSQSPR